MNPSPLRYPGGKYKLYKYVAELVKENGCKTYIEPFCGGAAIALELLFDGTVNNNIINDYDYTIFCFWDSVLHRTEEFVRLIENTEITLEEWHRQKAVRDNEFKLAIWCLVICIFSVINNIMLKISNYPLPILALDEFTKWNAVKKKKDRFDL